MNNIHRYYIVSTRDCITRAVDITTDITTCMFDFCVRKYKRTVQPAVYPFFKTTSEYTIKTFI